MIYGRRKVEELVSRMVIIPPDREAALELVYALLFPELPPTLAEIILANPSLAESTAAFPANLAFGLVDTGLEYREESLRNERYRSLFRQVHALGYELAQREFPCALSSATESLFWLLSKATQSAKDLAVDEPIPGSIRAAFTEQLLLAISAYRELMLLLLTRISAGWSEGKKASAIRVIGSTAEEALKNPPIFEAALLHEAGGPPRFHRANLENKSFRSEAERVSDSLASAFGTAMRRSNLASVH